MPALSHRMLFDCSCRGCGCCCCRCRRLWWLVCRCRLTSDTSSTVAAPPSPQEVFTVLFLLAVNVKWLQMPLYRCPCTHPHMYYHIGMVDLAASHWIQCNHARVHSPNERHPLTDTLAAAAWHAFMACFNGMLESTTCMCIYNNTKMWDLASTTCSKPKRGLLSAAAAAAAAGAAAAAAASEGSSAGASFFACLCLPPVCSMRTYPYL